MSSAAVVAFTVHPVPGDGHCFFWSVSAALLADREGGRTTPSDVAQTRRLMLDLRDAVARQAVTRRRRKTSTMIVEAVNTCILPGLDCCYLGNTALDALAQRGWFGRAAGPLSVDDAAGEERVRRVREAFADIVRTSATWASFVEVELVRAMLKSARIALVVVPSRRSLASVDDWAKALRVLSDARYDAVLVLLNDGGVHYSYVSCDGRTLPRLAHLKQRFRCPSPGA